MTSAWHTQSLPEYVAFCFWRTQNPIFLIFNVYNRRLPSSFFFSSCLLQKHYKLWQLLSHAAFDFHNWKAITYKVLAKSSFLEHYMEMMLTSSHFHKFQLVYFPGKVSHSFPFILFFSAKALSDDFAFIMKKAVKIPTYQKGRETKCLRHFKPSWRRVHHIRMVLPAQTWGLPILAY